VSNIERKIVLSESEKAEKERMNVYYRDLLDKMKAIDEEIIYRKQLRKEDFRQDVDKLKVQKNGAKEGRTPVTRPRARQIVARGGFHAAYPPTEATADPTSYSQSGVRFSRSPQGYWH